MAAAFLGACATPAPRVLTGELEQSTRDGSGSVRDCMTGEVFALRTLTSGQWQRAAALAARRDGASDAQVIVALEGEISDGSPRSFSVSRVVEMWRGTCDDPLPGR